MPTDLHKKLREELGVASWRMLQPHHKRGALLLLASDLDMVEVAVAIAQDQVPAIQAWLSSGHLGRPSAEHITLWDQAGASFHFLIVQPYVLISPILDA